MTSEGASENTGETFFGQVCLVLLPHVGLVTDSTLASLLGCWSPLRADSRDVGQKLASGSGGVKVFALRRLS